MSIDLASVHLKHVSTVEQWDPGEDTKGPPNRVVRCTNDGRTLVAETWERPARIGVNPPTSVEVRQLVS